jgi:flagellar protein FlaF
VAVAELIGAAIGVLLLVIVAYLLVGSTLSTAETVVTAQKDMTLLNDARMRTSIIVSDEWIDNSSYMNFNITNTGEGTVMDLPHLDVFSFDTLTGYTYLTYDSTKSGSPDPGTWQIVKFYNAHIHADEMDPGVTLWIKANIPAGETADLFHLDNFQFTTSNGVSAYSAVLSP